MKLLKNEKRENRGQINSGSKKIKREKRCHFCKRLGNHTARSCKWKPPKSILNDPIKVSQWHKDQGTPEEVIKNSLLSWDKWRYNFDPDRKKYIEHYFSKTGKNK